MPTQLGPSPNSEFPDKELENKLKEYLTIFKKDRELLLDNEKIFEEETDIQQNQFKLIIALLDQVEKHFQVFSEYLYESRSAQDILPYRYELLLNLQHASMLLKELRALISKSVQLSSPLGKDILSLFKRLIPTIQSVQDDLKIGLSRPLYPKYLK